MKKNEEERDEAIDEQTDHLNQEQTSSETGSKTILTGPIPKSPQDVEVRQYWFKNWHKINISKLHYSYSKLILYQILLSHIVFIDFLHSQQWNSISGKGCFFLDVPDRSDSLISYHHYALTLPERSSVWMESLPGTCVCVYVSGDHDGAEIIFSSYING